MPRELQNTFNTTMEEAFQLLCAVEKGGAPRCHVSYGGSALPTPSAHGMVGRVVEAHSRSASKALWKKGSQSGDCTNRR